MRFRSGPMAFGTLAVRQLGSSRLKLSVEQPGLTRAGLGPEE